MPTPIFRIALGSTANPTCGCGIPNCQGHAMDYTAIAKCNCGIENCQGHAINTLNHY
jgi:hypothetical protein